VTVNAVAPGFIVTDMTAATAQRVGMSFEDFQRAAVAQIPVGRSDGRRTSPPRSRSSSARRRSSPAGAVRGGRAHRLTRRPVRRGRRAGDTSCPDDDAPAAAPRPGDARRVHGRVRRGLAPARDSRLPVGAHACGRHGAGGRRRRAGALAGRPRRPPPGAALHGGADGRRVRRGGPLARGGLLPRPCCAGRPGRRLGGPGRRHGRAAAGARAGARASSRAQGRAVVRFGRTCWPHDCWDLLGARAAPRRRARGGGRGVRAGPPVTAALLCGAGGDRGAGATGRRRAGPAVGRRGAVLARLVPSVDAVAAVRWIWRGVCDVPEPPGGSDAGRRSGPAPARLSAWARGFSARWLDSRRAPVQWVPAFLTGLDAESAGRRRPLREPFLLPDAGQNIRSASRRRGMMSGPRSLSQGTGRRVSDRGG
jgi:hypothetical protein